MGFESDGTCTEIIKKEPPIQLKSIPEEDPKSKQGGNLYLLADPPADQPFQLHPKISAIR